MLVLLLDPVKMAVVIPLNETSFGFSMPSVPSPDRPFDLFFVGECTLIFLVITFAGLYENPDLSIHLLSIGQNTLSRFL